MADEWRVDSQTPTAAYRSFCGTLGPSWAHPSLRHHAGKTQDSKICCFETLGRSTVGEWRNCLDNGVFSLQKSCIKFHVLSSYDEIAG